MDSARTRRIKRQRLNRHSINTPPQGWRFYAPGVVISETLYILCQKLQSGSLTAADYDFAIQRFNNLMRGVLPPPQGDPSLVLRAAQIGRGYGCSRSSDSIYIALAEQLTTLGAGELATFDTGIKNHAADAAPTVVVRLLPVAVP